MNMNMNMHIKLRRFCVWLLLCGAGWVHAQPETAVLETSVDGADRASIQHERQAIDRALGQAEAACYQRFAVEDCLRQERKKARKAQTRLRQQETTLDQTERCERAAQRLKAIAERESMQPAPMPATSRVKEATAPAPAAPPVRSGPEEVKKAPRPDTLDRDQQARERARQQQEKRKAHQASQAAAVSSQSAQAAKARQRQEEKNAAAAQHKAQVLKSQADDAAAGRTPAAPLSPSP